MNLANRIARLEAKFASTLPAPTPESFPVLAITLRGDPEDKGPYSIEHDGKLWEQRSGETVAELHARVHSEALKSFDAQEEHPVLITVARQRSRVPDLREKTSPGATQTDVQIEGD